MTIHCKAVEQYFTMVLCAFQFYPVCNFEKLINFGLGTERVTVCEIVLATSELNAFRQLCD